MTIDDLIEGRIEGLTMDNFPAPQVETVEVPIFIIPTWLKWVCGLGILALLFFLIRNFIKTVVIQKHLKEIEQLKLFNNAIIASKIVAEEKLNYYGLR